MIPSRRGPGLESCTRRGYVWRATRTIQSWTQRASGSKINEVIEASWSSGRDHARVTCGGTRLIIEVEPGEPVSGWASREGGPREPFDGILDFLLLFEHLRGPEEGAVIGETGDHLSGEI